MSSAFPVCAALCDSDAQARGKQYAWRFLLALVCAALLSGHKTVRAIAGWARRHGDELPQQLQPAKPRIPSAATLGRALRRVDITPPERQVAAHGQQVDASDPSIWAHDVLAGAKMSGPAQIL